MLRFLFLLACRPAVPEPSVPSGPLREEAFVWQHAWTPAVSASVAAHGDDLDALTVLRAEVGWEGNRPATRWIAPDRAVLQGLRAEVGLAVRILPYAGADPQAAGIELAALVTTLLAEDPWIREVHIDFDAQSHALAAYADWLRRLRVAVGPTRRLTITALPDWLHREDFIALTDVIDRYALQVHWLAPPQHWADPLSLMDAAQTQLWVNQAAALGAPFHVALPTYGYRVAYDIDTGVAIGVSAEPGRAAAGARWREVRADPAQIAPLIAAWRQSRPDALQGVSWYRLPVEGDALNWRWETLAAVRQGNIPLPHLEARVIAASGEGLVDVWIENTGDADGQVSSVAVNWADPAVDLLAADGLGGMRWEAAPRRFSVPGGEPIWLAAGASRAVGWLRLSSATPVSASSEP